MIRVGIILAAGRSTRFGASNKLLAPLEGRPVVTHASETLQALSLEHTIILISDPLVAEAVPDMEVVVDPALGEAQSRTIARAAQMATALRADRLLVMLGDMPRVTTENASKVLAACTDELPASAWSDPSPTPPVCFPASWFASLQALTGDGGAGSLLRDLPLSQRIAMPSDRVIDIDTPDALRKCEDPTLALE